MSFWVQTAAIVLLGPLVILGAWDVVDMVRDRPRPCACGTMVLHAFGEHTPDHVLHFRDRCQPCREVL